MPKNEWGVEMKPAYDITISTAWVAKRIDVSEDHETTVTLLCISQDYDTAYSVFIEALPNKIVHWNKRYHHWSADTVCKIRAICPLMDTYEWLQLNSFRHTPESPKLYDLNYKWDVEHGEETPLTFDQKEALCELLGSYWDQTGSSHMEYQFGKVALVPIS
jgi:hypothetical protein